MLIDLPEELYDNLVNNLIELCGYRYTDDNIHLDDYHIKTLVELDKLWDESKNK